MQVAVSAEVEYDQTVEGRHQADRTQIQWRVVVHQGAQSVEGVFPQLYSNASPCFLAGNNDVCDCVLLSLRFGL